MTMKETKMPKAKLWQLCGRGERIRTFDPLVPNQMRYQAALRPDSEYSNRLQQGNWPAAAKSLSFLLIYLLFHGFPFPALA